MKRIKLNRLKISINTTEGLFGSDITFQEGLNILRARNSKGKSSTLNVLLYVLGLEEMLGGRNAKTMKPVLKDKLSFKGQEVAIIESKVQLETSNHIGEIITITRWIKSSTVDERLIRVHFGPQLSKIEEVDFEDFYVHMKGSASEDAGFHTFLSNFLEWELPKVPTFESGDRLLYIQTIFPLFFIEQSKGWSSFYSAIPGNFGIRNLSKRAFEFLLNMDVTKNTKEREELKIINALLSNKWSALKQDVEDLARAIHAEVPSFSEKPTRLDSLKIYNDNKQVVSIIERIYELESLIKDIEGFGVVQIANVAKEYESKVKEQEVLVLQLQNELNTVRRDLHLERNNKQSMEENLKNLEIDLKRNQEAEKLNRLGSDIDSSFSQGICPTCSQYVEDSLMPPESIKPLGLSENITFIKEQINTLKFGIRQSQKVIQNKHSKLNVITEHLDNARRELRLYKSELNGNPKVPTKRELDKLVELKIHLNKLYDANNSFEKIEQRFELIKEEWREYLSRQEALPKDYFSVLDKKKLIYFEKEFITLLETFGFSSIDTDEITISRDKFTPIVSGFDIKFGSSASDNIRLIWSYVIAIYKTSQQFSGNHPGLMVFDEPGQQQMAVESQNQLFEVLSRTKGQAIVGTSLEPEEIKEMTKKYTLNVIDMGEDYIIKPLNK